MLDGRVGVECGVGRHLTKYSMRSLVVGYYDEGQQREFERERRREGWTRRRDGSWRCPEHSGRLEKARGRLSAFLGA